MTHPAELSLMREQREYFAGYLERRAEDEGSIHLTHHELRQIVSALRSPAPGLEAAAQTYWVVEQFKDGRSQGYWDGGSSRSFDTNIRNAIQFRRRRDAFWMIAGWHWQDVQLVEHMDIPALARKPAREERRKGKERRVNPYDGNTTMRHATVLGTPKEGRKGTDRRTAQKDQSNPTCKECTGDGSACPYMGMKPPSGCLLAAQEGHAAPQEKPIAKSAGALAAVNGTDKPGNSGVTSPVGAAPASAGGEAVAYDYTKTFNAIAKAVRKEGDALAISCATFWSEYGHPSPAQGGEREKLLEEAIIDIAFGMHNEPQYMLMEGLMLFGGPSGIEYKFKDGRQLRVMEALPQGGERK